MRQAAVHLPGDDQRVDDGAAVVNAEVTLQGDDAGVGVDRDDGDVDAEGELATVGTEEAGLVEARLKAAGSAVRHVRGGGDARHAD